MKYDLLHITKQFQLRGDFLHAEPYGSGHINDTFIVTSRQNGQAIRYTLQRINHLIFKNPSAVMENVRQVTRHIRQKLQNEGSTDIDRQVLTVIPTCNGEICYRAPNGNYWRMYSFIEGTYTCDVLDSKEQAYQSARTFGRFQRHLADLHSPSLTETIPDFHNTPKRLKDFTEILARDSHNRAILAKPEIEFIQKNAGLCDTLLALLKTDGLPRRITHNDTKINNILFDTQTHESICVIDLDTVMPGLSLCDFGDMVRTATCKAAEDEQDLSKICMEMAFYEQIARGFAIETAGFLTDVEKKHLAFFGELITFEQMIRFLTDFLDGDTYYKIHRPEQNLDRTRTQMRLVQSMQRQEEQMNTVGDAIWKTL
jgi:Ser/Thr protein kinase RdoA (MazF antagonist)